MEKILALYDRDQNYTARFARYMKNRKQFPFAVYTFSDAAALKRFAERKEIEILLTAGEAEAACGAVPAKDVIHLTEDAIAADGYGKMIYKYQPGDAIVRELMGFYGNAAPCIQPGGSTAEVAMVFSPLGRCGKSTLALSLAKILSTEKRVLYLSFEENGWLADVTGGMQRNTLTEALYYYKEAVFDSMKLRAMVYQEGELDYILPVRNPSDLSALTEEELCAFLDTLCHMGLYDVIVVDTDSIISRFSEMFRLCRWIFMPEPEDSASAGKIRKFDAYLEKDAGEIRKRIIRVSNPNVPHIEGRRELQRLMSGEIGECSRMLIRNYVYDAM